MLSPSILNPLRAAASDDQYFNLMQEQDQEQEQEQPDSWTQNQNHDSVYSSDNRMELNAKSMLIDVECVRTDSISMEHLDSYKSSRSASAYPSPLSDSNPAFIPLAVMTSSSPKHTLSHASHSNSPHTRSRSHSRSRSDKVGMHSAAAAVAAATASVSSSVSAVHIKSDLMAGRPYLPWDSDSLRSSPTGTVPYCIVLYCAALYCAVLQLMNCACSYKRFLNKSVCEHGDADIVS